MEVDEGHDGGAAAFYTGGIAERLSADVRQQGGLITVADIPRMLIGLLEPLLDDPTLLLLGIMLQ